MTTYFTAHPAHPLGRWLVAFTGSLLLLALAYDHAPDPAWYLGLSSSSARTLANGRPVPERPHGHRLALGRGPALAAQVGQPTGRSSRPPFAH